MLSAITSQLSLQLRSPRHLVAIGVGTAAVVGIAWFALRRPRRSEEEIERERRDLLATIGRITDGSIIDTPLPQEGSSSSLIILYNYRISGVTYECAQDVTALTDHVRDVRADLPVQIRYDPHNPANSIVVAESWSGLRLNPHPHDVHERETS